MPLFSPQIIFSSRNRADGEAQIRHFHITVIISSSKGQMLNQSGGTHLSQFGCFEHYILCQSLVSWRMKRTAWSWQPAEIQSSIAICRQAKRSSSSRGCYSDICTQSSVSYSRASTQHVFQLIFPETSVRRRPRRCRSRRLRQQRVYLKPTNALNFHKFSTKYAY